MNTRSELVDTGSELRRECERALYLVVARDVPAMSRGQLDQLIFAEEMMGRALDYLKSDNVPAGWPRLLAALDTMQMTNFEACEFDRIRCRVAAILDRVFPSLT